MTHFLIIAWFSRSKKAAKHEAAASALKSFVQFKDACEAQMTIRRKKFMNLDFTSDLTALDPQGKTKYVLSVKNTLDCFKELKLN